MQCVQRLQPSCALSQGYLLSQAGGGSAYLSSASDAFGTGRRLQQSVLNGPGAVAATPPDYVYCAATEELQTSNDGTAVTFFKEWAVAAGPKPRYVAPDFGGLWMGELPLLPGKHHFSVFATGAMAVRLESSTAVIATLDNSRAGSVSEVIDVGEGEVLRLEIALLQDSSIASAVGRLEFRFDQLVGCGNDVEHGDTELRVRYAQAEVEDSQECESEEQTRVCEAGVWGPWSGTFQRASCGTGCAPGCLASMLLDSECQQQCNVPACAFDNNACRVQLLADAYTAKWMAFTNQEERSIQMLEQMCDPVNTGSEDSVQRLVRPPPPLVRIQLVRT